MDEDDKVALIDLDGSVVDYDTEMKKELEKLRSPDEPPTGDRYVDREGKEIAETPWLEARRKLVQAKPGFWRNLPKHPLGFHVIEEMRALQFQLHVLTKGPATTPGAWSKKFEWCRANLSDADVSVTQNKTLSYGRVLLDDWPPYFIPWLKHRPRGLVICIAQPWNADMDKIKMDFLAQNRKQDGTLPDIPNILRYDGTNREELKKKLFWAYNRPSRGE